MISVPLINDNPDRAARKLTMKDLEKLVGKANEEYYNGEATLTDYAYDTLVWYLNKKYKARDKRKAQIGALPRENIRCELPYFMPSLNKIKVGSGLGNFLHDQANIVWSLKLDGVSGMIVYNSGTPNKVYLRGNGEIGGDISFVLDHIKLPIIKDPLYGNIAIRGEFVIDKQVFLEKHAEESSNMRNLVSGTLNSLYSSDNVKDLSFVAFDITYLNNDLLPRPSKALRWLEKLGFETVKHGVIENPLCYEIISMYKREYTEHRYPIDGIVLSHDISRKVAPILANPTTIMAFKMNLEEQKRDTTVIDISWQISRHGRIIPVVEFEAVFIEGARVHRATGHNAYHTVKKWKLGKGTKITVTRSGGVIPTILSVQDDETIPAILPDIKWKWKWNGRDIVLVDPESCPEVHIKRQVYFFEILNIAGIREGMVRRMRENKLENLKEIIKADAERFRKVRGVGVKKSKQFEKNIKYGIENARLYRLMLGSCSFNRGLGKTNMRLIVNNVEDVMKEDDSEKLKKKLVKIRGIGPKRADTFVNGLGKFKTFLTNLDTICENNKNRREKLEKEGKNEKIDVKMFVFTQLEDDDLEDYLIDHGGKIGKTVNKNVEAVISGNLLLFTSKMEKAVELGIKVYSLAEFKEKFNVMC